MTSIFHRLHRLRKLEERTAQVALADAQAEREARQDDMTAVVESIRRSQHASADADPAVLATHHRFVLERELHRRSADRALDQATHRVSGAHREVVSRATAARTVELLAEAVEERASLESLHAEQRMFDEVAAQQWLRRAS